MIRGRIRGRIRGSGRIKGRIRVRGRAGLLRISYGQFSKDSINSKFIKDFLSIVNLLEIFYSK